MLEINEILPKTREEGPGIRFAIRLRGCGKHCPDCRTVCLPSSREGTEIPVSALIESIEAVRPAVCGVTFSGGEPFRQARALCRIADAAHGMGLSVLCLTGCAFADLVLGGNPDDLKLVLKTDLLVDGQCPGKHPCAARVLSEADMRHFHYITQRITVAEMAQYCGKKP